MSYHIAIAAVTALTLASSLSTHGSKNIEGFNPKKPYILTGRGKELTISPDGLGATPNNKNVEYLGFTVWMKPSEFLKLQPRRPRMPSEESKNAWREHGMGAPMMYVNVEIAMADENRLKELKWGWEDIGTPNEDENVVNELRERAKLFNVKAHEGRGRMHFIQEEIGDVEVPVSVIFNGPFRARHMLPELIEDTQFFGQGNVVPIEHFILDGVEHGPKHGSRAMSLSEMKRILNEVKSSKGKTKSKTSLPAESQTKNLHPLLRENLDFIQLHRCVLKVYEDKTDESLPPHERLSQAFAICVSGLQRNGFLVGRNPTGAGIARSRQKALEQGAIDKQRKYQEINVLAKESRRRARNLKSNAPAPSAIEQTLKSKRGAANRENVKTNQKYLKEQIQQIREAMNPVFSCETVWGDCKDDAPSAGHCFMASVAVQDMLGGEILFGKVKTDTGEISHYWNRIEDWEIDVTGDQFKEPEIQIKKGKIRESIAHFDRERFEWLTQDYNKEPMKIYQRFRKRLAKELSGAELRPLKENLMHMQKP